MPGWNLADVLDLIARHDPTATAQIEVGAHGDRRFSWGELDQRAGALAATLRQHGLTRQAKVAQYLFNCPEYLESVYACYKSSLVSVNTNYRYLDDELLYLWDNADIEAVVFHGSFAERIDAIRDRLPRVRSWLFVDDGTNPRPGWAQSYEEAARAPGGERTWERDGDDLWLLYTGGTTGMPKGVMWRQDDIFQLYNDNRLEPFDLDAGLEGLRNQLEEKLVRPIQHPACPLMHGTGFLTAQGALLGGGCVVTSTSRHYDAEATLDLIARERVMAMAIVGDAFARPLAQALDAHPGRWDISSMVSIVSSGAMWSEEVKRELLRHHPGMVLADGLGSSESIGMGRSESTGGAATSTARFELGDRACVLTGDGRRVEPGSGERGRIAVSGHLPVGYYKDAEKTAATFPVIDGVRYSVAGDWATVEPDGTIRLLGRGAVCINTGGEKVFPEEVEEELKRHPAVRDAVCVGLPDSRFGQVVTAVVELHQEPSEGVDALSSELIAQVRERHAAYKAPRHVLFREIERGANGKADYGGLAEWARRALES